MIRNNEVITETVNDEFVQRYFLNSISCNGGGNYAPINKNTIIMLHNAKMMCTNELQPITGEATSGGKVSVTIEKFLETLGVSYTQFAECWAKLTEDANKPLEFEVIEEPSIEEI